MRDSRTPWENTTHDWAAAVDPEHLAQIRQQPATYAPVGLSTSSSRYSPKPPTRPSPWAGRAGSAKGS